MTDNAPRSGKRRNPVLVMIALGIIALLTWWLGPDAPDSGDAGGSSLPTSSPSITFQDPGSEETPRTDTGPTEDTAPPGDEAGDPPGATDGIPACTDPLPAEADDVIADIAAGGPFDHPRNDGVTFQNREALLPDESQGYYREYTVQTPGSDDRGARRIVTGGDPPTDPEYWYFTDDHYDSFCAFAP